MSKTTIFLLTVFLILVGLLVFILFNKNENSIINSFTKQTATHHHISTLSLALLTNNQIVQKGQPIIVTVLITHPNPHPNLVQLELAYDPQVVTIDSLTPGNFLTAPEIALQNIDPIFGRISYALRCRDLTRNTTSDCVNVTSSTLATITLHTNQYTPQPTTSLSFLPKTVVRTQSGKDLLYQTTSLSLQLAKPIYLVATSSAIASPGANYFRATPIH